MSGVCGMAGGTLRRGCGSRMRSEVSAGEPATIDNNGVIYLVAEQLQGAGSPLNATSQLLVLTPIPEPSTWALMGVGLMVVGWRARRKV
jgi:hypothetical protein